QYQRYQDIRIAVDIIQHEFSGHKFTILDVGGFPTSQKFLSPYQVVIANTEAETGITPQCDGTQLPFQDNSFDIVITADTLEHIAETERKAFIDELLRVSNLFTIITAPFSNGYNEFSETVLNDFLIKFLDLHHRFLIEHLQNGLPDLERCLQWISKTSKNYINVPSGYIHHWLPLMILRHYFNRSPNGPGISADLERFYNYHCYWSDHRLPSYRQFIVVAKKEHTQVLAKIENTFAASDEASPPDLNGVVAMWQALNGTQILEERANEIQKLRQEVEALRELVTGYQSGRFIRLMTAVHQIIGIIKK
ncbi:MAG: methyltransferase domain-containing protein, partial [Chloroflexota bacterium]|nr:methyltransferase domain-containing protein [Chloroflexota bacterium]